MTPPPPNPPSGPAADPFIDWPAFEDDYDGQRSVVLQLLSTVIRTRSGDPDRLRAAAESGDVKTIRFLAHGLKTVGGLIRCRRVQEAARRAENAAAEGKDDAASLAADLAGALDLMLSEVRARVGDGESAGSSAAG